MATVAEEDAFTADCAHVAIGRVLRALGGELVQHALAEADQLLYKSSPTDSCPRRQSIVATNHDVQQQARVLEEPVHHRMVDGDRLVDALLQAELQGAEDATQSTDRLLDAAVGLRVIRGRVFLAGLFEVLAVDFDELKDALHKRLDGRFAIGLQDDLGVAEPGHG